MEKKVTKAAEKDINSLNKSEWREIKEKINQITSGLSHEDLKIIDNPILDVPIWQLTVDGESTNHRVFLDVDKAKLVVLAVWSYDYTHNGDEHWKKLSGRAEK